MNEIEKLDNKMTITTLEVAEMLEIPHYDILKKLEGVTRANGTVKTKGIIPVLTEGNFPVSDYFQISSYKDASGKENRCYNVTKLGCDFLANKFTGEKGILFTAKYVKRFDEMEKELETKKRPAALPTSYKEALLQLVAQIEENERLEAENRSLLPKAQFHDAVTASEDCITIEEMSKVLHSKGIQIGRNRLYQWLRIESVLMSNNLPYQKFMEAGYFKVHEYTFTDRQGNPRIKTQTLVTSKGQKAIVKSWEDFMNE